MTSAASLATFGGTEALLQQVFLEIQGGWQAEYFWQIAAFLLAVGLSFFVSRRFNRQLRRFLPQKGSDRLLDRALSYSIDIATHLSFSLIAASFLWLEVWLMQRTDLVPVRRQLVFDQLGYTVLYAFALLRIVLYMLHGMLGDRVVNRRLTQVVTWVFWILVAMEFAGILPEIVSFMKKQEVPIGSQNLTLWLLFTGTLSAFLTLGVANWIANVLEGVFTHALTIAPNLRVVFARICRWVLMVSAVLIAMSSVGIDLTVLSVFGGALGVGVGFGLQKIASNYISGFIILLDRSIKIGDFVELGGFKGTVKEINTRYTVVSDFYGVENIVPNETFVTSSVKNYYHSGSDNIAMIRISVAYGTDLNKAIQILREEANKPARVIKDKKGWTGITQLGDSGIDLEAAVWVPNIGNGTLGLRTEILINVLRRFDEAGIEVPFPQMDVRLKEGGLSKPTVEELARAFAILSAGEQKAAGVASAVAEPPRQAASAAGR